MVSSPADPWPPCLEQHLASQSETGISDCHCRTLDLRDLTEGCGCLEHLVVHWSYCKNCHSLFVCCMVNLGSLGTEGRIPVHRWDCTVLRNHPSMDHHSYSLMLAVHLAWLTTETRTNLREEILRRVNLLHLPLFHSLRKTRLTDLWPTIM